MRKLCLFVLTALIAAPATAQRRIEITIDAEGVRRTAREKEFRPNEHSFDFDLTAGGGAGGAIAWYITDRLAVEGKVAGLLAHLKIRSTGSDFVSIADLGRVQIYPVMAVLQWHMNEKGALRPYVGAGAGRVILRNIEKASIAGTTATGVSFKDPTGLLLDAGLRYQMSSHWSVSGDVRYMPIETQGHATFTALSTTFDVDVKPLIAGFGLSYRF